MHVLYSDTIQSISSNSAFRNVILVVWNPLVKYIQKLENKSEPDLFCWLSKLKKMIEEILVTKVKFKAVLVYE